MRKQTFKYICQQVGPLLIKVDTNRRRAISLKTRVAIALTRLASSSPLYIIVDSFRVGVSSVHGIVLEFCQVLKEICRDVFIRWPSPSQMQVINENFETLHGIPYVVGAIHDSHILIIAPEEHTADYYCRKKFYFVLLQAVIDHSCCFWDYDIGWCDSIHDYNLFCKSHKDKYCLSEKLLRYALLEDVACQPRPWMFTPYLGSKDGFICEQEHWNFIQSSSRMCVERAFGILKLRWKILLKMMDCQLRHVTACLILHNLTIMHNDTFYMSWFEDGQI
jgi:hypothetical protein